MKREQKLKNILDLRYQKLLNYFNITIIGIISASIALIFPNLNSLDIKEIIYWIIAILILILIIWMLFETELSKIKQEIEKLD